MKQLWLEGSSHPTIVMTKLNFAKGAEDTMSVSKTKEEYIKLDGNNKKKFWEWSIKTKAIGTRKGWVKVLTEDLKIDQKATDEASKKAVMLNNLAYHHLVMSCTDKAFYYVQAAQDLGENGNAWQAWKSCCQYADVLENDLIALTIEFNVCKMKNASKDPTLWYVELEHIHQCMKKAGAQKKSEAEMIVQIILQIPEEYEVAMQAIWIMPVANHTLKAVQWIYINLWNTKYKNKTPVNIENVALYTNRSRNKSGKPWKKFKGDCKVNFGL